MQPLHPRSMTTATVTSNASSKPQLDIPPINRLPSEVLARVFVVGSSLPSRLKDPRKAGWKMETRHPQLKPFAKLASRVCLQWHILIHWRSLRKHLWHSTLTLHFPGEVDEFVVILAKYLQRLAESEDMDLDISWRCNLYVRAFLNDPSLLDVYPALAIRLFMHGMNLTARYMCRVSTLCIEADQPQILDLCLCLMDRLDRSSRLTQLYMSGDEGGNGVLSSVPFAPGFSALSARCSSCRPVASLDALTISNIYAFNLFTSPNRLSHLSLQFDETGDSIEWNDLRTLLLQSRSLLTLKIVTQLPIEDIPGEVVAPGIILPELVELDLGYCDTSTISSVLMWLDTPHLRLLRLHPRVSSNEGGVWAPGLNDYLAPPHVHLHFYHHQLVWHVLTCMLIDHVKSLHLSWYGMPGPREGSEVNENEVLQVNLPNLTELRLRLGAPVSWDKLLQCLRMPSFSELSYTAGYGTGEDWHQFANIMPEVAATLTELTLSAYNVPLRDAISCHPFHSASLVEVLTLTDVDKDNIAALKWLEWPEVGESGPSLTSLDTIPRALVSQATMPRLRSLGISLSEAENQRHDWDLFEESGRLLHVVALSRLTAGRPLEHIFIKDDEGQLIWSSNCPERIQQELMESKSHIKTKHELLLADRVNSGFTVVP